MEDISESVESWLRDSHNTEFDKKAKEVIRLLGENEQRFNLKNPFNKRDYEEGVGKLVRRLIYVQKMAILPDTLPRELTEKPEDEKKKGDELMVWTAKRGMVPIDEILEWAKGMKPSRPLGIEDDERRELSVP